MSFKLFNSLTIKKSLLSMAVASAFVASSVQADSCGFEVNYDINLAADEIKLDADNQQRVRISQDNSLYLEGEKQSLNSQQKELLAVYAADIRAFIPAVSDVATEASGLVQEATKDVSAILFSDTPQKAQKFSAAVLKITAEIKQHVSENHLRPSAIEAYFENNEFEQEFETLLEEAVAEFVKGNVGEIIAAALSGDDEKVEAFEQRMEKFGEEMESKFENKGELIEQKAEALCELVANIESNENAFVKSFEKYDDYQLLTD